MAWTDPRTWVTDELVTAAIMNTHVRDNLNALNSHLIARKTADQSVTSSTVLVNDSDLQLTVAANEVWLLQYLVRFDGSLAGNIKFTWTFPASGRIDASANGTDPTGSSITREWSITANDASPLAFDTAGAGAGRFLRIEGIYVGAGTAGTVILRWAQDTSDATATKMLAQSTLWGVKLA